MMALFVDGMPVMRRPWHGMTVMRRPLGPSSDSIDLRPRGTPIERGSLLFDVGAVDLTTFVFVLAMLLLLTLVAGSVPAYRLLAVNPLRALNPE